MTESVIDVQGMTCAHCVSAVIQEVTKIDGVTSVDVELHPGATSHVRVSSSDELASSDVQAAIREAGYEILPS